MIFNVSIYTGCPKTNRNHRCTKKKYSFAIFVLNVKKGTFEIPYTYNG